MIYNLSICCVDGETTYSLISPNKADLLKFLETYDHEGSTIILIRQSNSSARAYETYEPDEIYAHLSSPV